jgi:hypothetical protein
MNQVPAMKNRVLAAENGSAVIRHLYDCIDE